MDSLPRRLGDLLRADPRVVLIYVFGSRARETAREGSDLDVAVLMHRSLSLDEELLLRADVAEAGAPEQVDLVIVNAAGPVLLYEVISGGRCLFARDERAHAEFEITGLSRFQDFQPVRQVQDAYRRARLEARRGTQD